MKFPCVLQQDVSLWDTYCRPTLGDFHRTYRNTVSLIKEIPSPLPGVVFLIFCQGSEVVPSNSSVTAEGPSILLSLWSSEAVSHLGHQICHWNQESNFVTHCHSADVTFPYCSTPTCIGIDLQSNAPQWRVLSSVYTWNLWSTIWYNGKPNLSFPRIQRLLSRPASSLSILAIREVCTWGIWLDINKQSL